MCHSVVVTLVLCALSLLTSFLRCFFEGTGLTDSNVAQIIDSLRFGDLIQVDWLDASESTGRLGGGRFDTPVCSVGFFLGVKGRRARHVVIAKEIVDVERALHYNSIPVRVIERINIHKRGALDVKGRKVLKKFVSIVMPRIRDKDGWIRFKG